MGSLKRFISQARRDWDDRAARDSQGYADGWAQADEKEHEARADETYRSLEKLIPPSLRPLGRALDLGCGTGRLMARLAPHARGIVGVDISKEMLRQSRDVLKGNGSTRVVLGGGLDLRYLRDGAFDLAYAFAVFIHIPRELFKQYLTETHRVLRPGGCLIFMLARPESLRRKIKAVLKLEPTKRTTWHRRFYTRGQLERLARDHGFTPIQWVEEGPMLWASWARA